MLESVKHYLGVAAVAVAAVFAPIQAAIIAIFVLTVVDLISGVMASIKEKTPITSEGLKRTVIKLFLYETAICMAFLVQTYLTGDLFPASKLVTALVGLVELKSLLENFDRITGDSFFKNLIAKVTSAQDDLEKK